MCRPWSDWYKGARHDTVIRADNAVIGPVPGNLNGARKNFFKGTLKTQDHLVGVLETENIFKF